MSLATLIGLMVQAKLTAQSSRFRELNVCSSLSRVWTSILVANVRNKNFMIVSIATICVKSFFS